jgi:glutamine amidotransferase
MSAIWDAQEVPSLQQRFQVFNYFALEMQSLGLANFIYSDSEYVFVFSDKREVKDKKDKNKTITLPGLHVLQRSCQSKSHNATIQGLSLKHKQSKNVVLVSSVPLNGENWTPLTTGQSLVFKAGEIVSSIGV